MGLSMGIGKEDGAGEWEVRGCKISGNAYFFDLSYNFHDADCMQKIRSVSNTLLINTALLNRKKIMSKQQKFHYELTQKYQLLLHQYQI
jgi:hypothetical protein